MNNPMPVFKSEASRIYIVTEDGDLEPGSVGQIYDPRLKKLLNKP